MARRARSDLTSDPKHGPLPALLLTLTIVTGLVDAVSILSLGRVFVANMTGNVVFIGFALAGAPGFSLAASLFALGGFLVGAFAAGFVIDKRVRDRGDLLAKAVSAELVLIAGCSLITQVGSLPYSSVVRDGVAALASVAMGIQNATARRLAVPDLTTTVLTMTLTGIAADMRQQNRPALIRRALSIVTMLGGAVAGAALVDNVRPSASFEVATGLIAVVAFSAWRVAEKPAAWQTA